MYAATSCTYKIENKAEGCSILFATSPACACPPSPPLRSAACCWGSSGSFQRSSRDSLGCQMSDVSGLHAGVFFLDRRRGLPMQQKKKKGEKQNVQQKSSFLCTFLVHLFPLFLELWVVWHSSWQSPYLYTTSTLHDGWLLCLEQLFSISGGSGHILFTPNKEVTNQIYSPKIKTRAHFVPYLVNKLLNCVSVFLV